MMSLPRIQPTVGTSACPVVDCDGYLDECADPGCTSFGTHYACTNVLSHFWLASDLAACTRCDGPAHSDRETVQQALAGTGRSGETWLLVEGEGLVCPTHLGPCYWCDQPTLLDGALCVDSFTVHCPSCLDDRPCLACAADDAAHEYADAIRQGDYR